MERVGWEPIWSSDYTPPRYASFAPPNDSVVEWANHIPAGASVLDLGCGVGRHVTYLAGRGFNMAGADISPTGVQRTQAACAERGWAFDGRVCDITMLPWPDQAFDAVLSTSTIHHALRANIQRSIAEVWRLLKPGGLFLVDFLRTDRADYHELRAKVTAGLVLEVEPNTFVDERLDSDDFDGYLPHHYSDEADLRDLLQRFTIERVWAATHAPQVDTDDGRRGKWIVSARK